MRIARSLTVLTLALLVACDGGKKEEGLPPATGDGAPATKKLPKTASTKDGASASSPSANKVAAPAERYVGSVVARERVELGPKATGMIAKVYVDEGDVVKKGQLLFELDQKQLRLNVLSNKKALAAAKVQAAEAKRELDRQTQLATRGSTSTAVVERTNTAAEAADLQIEMAKVGLSSSQAMLSDAKIYSPIDGVVMARLKHPGETAAMMPPTVVLVVQDTKHLEVRVRVPELALKRFQKGAKFTAKFPALDIERELEVTRLGDEVDARTRTIEVIALVDNTDGTLIPGMFVEISPANAAPPATGAASGAAPPPAVVPPPDSAAAAQGSAADADEPKDAKGGPVAAAVTTGAGAQP
jgi:RND family efflux transporter MFP subunit